MSTLALIGMGSNLGDRHAILAAAVASLAAQEGISVRAVSTWHETSPVGGPSGQGPFLNAAAELETTLEPFDLLRRLQDVEAHAGRVRPVRWGERTLDLDLLLFGEKIIDAPGLTVPHPWMAIRRFVLAPLAEIAPEAIDPVMGASVQSLLDNLDRRPSLLALWGWWKNPDRSSVFTRLLQPMNAAAIRLSENLPSIPDVEIGDAAMAHALKRIHASSSMVSRWIVCDFASDEFTTGLCSEPNVPSLLRPTLIVIVRDHRAAVEPLPRPSSVAGSRRTPTIWIDSDEPDELRAQILTACAATRIDPSFAGPPAVRTVLPYGLNR